MEQYTTVDHRSTLTCRLGALGRLEQLTDRLLLGEESQSTTTSPLYRSGRSPFGQGAFESTPNENTGFARMVRIVSNFLVGRGMLDTCWVYC